MMLAARYGIARGLFTNEAGMGSAPIIAAAARTRNPVRQALIASTATFWDTVVVCLITGLVLVSSILRGGSVPWDTLSGGELTTRFLISAGPFLSLALSPLPMLLYWAGLTMEKDVWNIYLGKYLCSPIVFFGYWCLCLLRLCSWSWCGAFRIPSML